MDELLKAIDDLKRAYKASEAKYLHIEVADDGHIDLVEIVNSEGRTVMDAEFTEAQDKPLTNGEWLRGLSDNELVSMLDYEIVLGKSCDDIQCNDCEGCQNRVLAWLRAEHKE